MSLDDQRYYEELVGIVPLDWYINFGTFSNHHYLLERDYIDSGCATLDSSQASITHYFIYPHYTKKIYFVEGVIVGQIALGSSLATSTVTSYRVTLCKMGSDNSDSELKSSGWVTVNIILPWDSGLGIGAEIVLPFWIDCWQEQQVQDEERLYMKIEVECDNNCILFHGNDSSFIDVKIEIPIRG